MSGIRITVTDLDHPEDTNTAEMMDDYCLITAGSAKRTNITVHYAKDGTQTHVITVKGIKSRATTA